MIREVGRGIPAIFPVFLVALGLVIGIVSSRASMRLLFVSVPLVALLCLASNVPSWATLVIATSMTDFFVLLVIVEMMLMVALGAGGGLVFRRFSGLSRETATS